MVNTGRTPFTTSPYTYARKSALLTPTVVHPKRNCETYLKRLDEKGEEDKIEILNTKTEASC